MKTLEYDRIDLSKGIDTTKNKLVSRECSLCGFWYFIEQNFKYQKYLCDVVMICLRKRLV